MRFCRGSICTANEFSLLAFRPDWAWRRRGHSWRTAQKWSVRRGIWPRLKSRPVKFERLLPPAAEASKLVQLDLASLKSVRACADALVAKGEPFDVVIANAGVMATPFSFTTDRFEMQFGTNHLGHFVLVNRIAPLIRTGGRMINLSSLGHRFSNVNLEDPNFEKTPYDPWVGYGRSKTANILFAVAFDRRHRDRGVRAAAVHPGGIRTELGRHLEPDFFEKRIEQINQQLGSQGKAPFQWKTIPQGAATSVWAGVVAPADEIGGRYCENCHVARIVARDVTAGTIVEGVLEYALDANTAEALWKKSEELVGENFQQS